MPHSRELQKEQIATGVPESEAGVRVEICSPWICITNGLRVTLEKSCH